MFRVVKRLYSNIKNFDNLELLNDYLGKNQFSHTLVYFRANWNPNCHLTDKHIEQFAKEHDNVEIIKVDSDISPKIAKHYGVKAEPEFVFCLWGDDVIRQLGANYEGLK